MPAPELAELAAEIFGAERVRGAPRMDDAIEEAIGLAETDNVGAPGSDWHVYQHHYDLV